MFYRELKTAINIAKVHTLADIAAWWNAKGQFQSRTERRIILAAYSLKRRELVNARSNTR